MKIFVQYRWKSDFFDEMKILMAAGLEFREEDWNKAFTRFEITQERKESLSRLRYEAKSLKWIARKCMFTEFQGVFDLNFIENSNIPLTLKHYLTLPLHDLD